MAMKKKEGYEKIHGKWYPKLKVEYAGKIENHLDREDIEIVNERSEVRRIAKKCFRNHPEIKDFEGYLINKKQGCEETYGFCFPFPYPSKTVYKITMED